MSEEGKKIAKTVQIVVTFILYVIVFGTVAAGASNDNLYLTWGVILVCAFFGWKALNKIQPSMFLWMSWTGWLFYFFIKFLLSTMVGVFIAPYKIGQYIGGALGAYE